MARTGGTTRKPLPPSVVVGLTGLGLVAFTPPGADTKGAHHFMLPARPTFVVTAVASRIPGESAVIAQWDGQASDRFEPDTLITLLRHRVAQVTSPTQRAADILDQLGIEALA